MKKLDLLKIRKSLNLSQKELADRLAVQPSFISAIENGRSRFPEEKLEKLREIAGLESLEDFMTEESQETAVVPPHTHLLDESDSISQLLRHIHNLAHKNDEAPDKNRESRLLERIEILSRRNDSLSERLDDLRLTVDTLREENYRLKELLVENGIKIPTNKN